MNRRLRQTRRSLAFAGVMLVTAGCPASRPPQLPTPPRVLAPAEPAPPLVTQKFADPLIPARAFDDPRRAERVLSTIGELDTLLREAQTEEGKGYPALAVGIVVDGRLVWSRGYGRRTGAGSVARDSGASDSGASDSAAVGSAAVGSDVDDSTVFRIGSITKTFTGMAALRLRDMGKLDFDRPAHDYLPALGGIRYPASDTRPITVRQLLTHTSGLARNPPVFLPVGQHMTREKLLGGFDGFSLQTPPLRELRYSNLGVGTVGLIAEAIEGKRYRTIIGDTILRPLGMTSSYWEAGAVPAGRLATGHDRSGKPLTHAQHLVIGPSEGSGGLYSTIADMARFTALHLAAWPSRSGPDPSAAILARSALRESHTMARFAGMSARLPDAASDSGGGIRASANGTGIAWQIKQTCDIEHLVWHNGATAGYTAALFMAPRRGVGIILLASGKRSVTGLAQRVLRRIIASVDLQPRTARPSPVLEAHIQGPIRETFATGTLTLADFNAHFSPSFRASVPHPSMAALQQRIFDESGPCHFARYLDVPAPTDAWIEITCQKGDPYALWLRLDFAHPQRLAGYLLEPLSAHKSPSPKPRCTPPPQPNPAPPTKNPPSAIDNRSPLNKVPPSRSGG